MTLLGIVRDILYKDIYSFPALSLSLLLPVYRFL